MLGTKTDLGPFVFFNRRGNVDPLLSTGVQTLDYAWPLGFSGKPAVLRTDVLIKDEKGLDRTISGEFEWQLFPSPVVRSPVGVTIRQNDPRSGCPFDPIHGYGILLEIAWDPPPGSLQVDQYGIAVADGAGTEIIWPFYAHTANTSLRFVRCDLHVPIGAEHGARVAVNADSYTYHTASGWAIARFDFQSCREAGTPACR